MKDIQFIENASPYTVIQHNIKQMPVPAQNRLNQCQLQKMACNYKMTMWDRLTIKWIVK